ncbi:MAG: hypothetical protein EG828_06130 [Deltaproteobacteria bacterium]|nr:hypothetical protein [Deltaproteobacteria bacterium]
MKKLAISLLILAGSVLSSGCASMQTWPVLSPVCGSMQTWPDAERSAENKMVVILDKIAEGENSGTLTPDLSRMYLTKLKGILTDYELLKNKRVFWEEWNSLHARLDLLEAEIHRKVAGTVRIGEPSNGDRITALQKRIDDGKICGRLPAEDQQVFQTRLDSIRGDYLLTMAELRAPTSEERTVTSCLLDTLETEMNTVR